MRVAVDGATSLLYRGKYLVFTSDAQRLQSQDLDLLIRDSEIEAIKADLLATGQYELVEQDLRFRLEDPYTLQVPRLRLKTDNNFYPCISLWSEHVYMLNVDGEKVEVPETHAWNVVLMEERFDLDISWANAVPIGYSIRTANGVMILPAIRTQSADKKYPIYIPSIPRMLDAQLDQVRYRSTDPENFPLDSNRPRYHLRNFIRYLHLEKPTQREKVLPELAERNRGELEVLLDKYKRKPLLTSSFFAHLVKT